MALTSRLMLAVLSCIIGSSFQYGFHLGFVNNAATYVRGYYEENGVEPVGDDDHFRFVWSVVVSIFALGGVVGTFALPPIANRIGRKKSLLLCSIPCYMASALMGFAPSWWALIMGRVLVGLGCGGGLSVVSMYISEISPISLRGGLGTSSQLLITIGIAASQALTTERFHLLGGSNTWQYMMLFPFACNCFLCLCLPFCPDSPSYLLRARGEAAAEDALRWFRGGVSAEAIEREMRTMREEKAMSKAGNVGAREIARDPTLWKPIVVGMFVNLSMQMSGIDAVFFYSTMVFSAAGIDTLEAQVWTTLVGVVNVLVTIPAMIFMDSAGRKLILSVGLGGMCASFLVITFAMVNGLHTLSIYCMVSIIIFFAFGPGCVGWFIVSELSPIHARAFGTSLGLGVNWFANWFVGFMFPHLLSLLGNWSFAVFFVTTGALTLFTRICVPETKGKTIAEVAQFFNPHMSDLSEPLAFKEGA